MLKLLRCILMVSVISAVSPLSVYAQSSSPFQSGRFQIIFNPNARLDTFLLDTQTGKVWQRTSLSDVIGEPTVWLPMERLDDDKQIYQFLQTHGLKETEKPSPPSSESQR